MTREGVELSDSIASTPLNSLRDRSLTARFGLHSPWSKMRGEGSIKRCCRKNREGRVKKKGRWKEGEVKDRMKIIHHQLNRPLGDLAKDHNSI